MDTEAEASSIPTVGQLTVNGKVYTLTNKGIELRDMILEWFKSGQEEQYDIARSIGKLTHHAAAYCKNVLSGASYTSELDNLFYVMRKLVGGERKWSVFFDASRNLTRYRPQSELDILLKFFHLHPSRNVPVTKNDIQSLAKGLGVTYDRANVAVSQGWGRRGLDRKANCKAEHALKHLGLRGREDAPSATEELTAMSALTITDEGGSSTGTTAQQQTETSVTTVSNLAKRNSDGTTTQPVPDNWYDSGSESGDA